MSTRLPTTVACFCLCFAVDLWFAVDAFAQDASLPATPGHESTRLDVHIVTDEADAVLAILAKQRTGGTPQDDDWARLFDSTGYRRLRQREAQMQRFFTDDEFRKFVATAELAARAPSLERTLKSWITADPIRAAQKALAYLPADARIRATIYPVIKPQGNSFVFDLGGDPAIFLYLDPEQTAEQFENTLAHEMHHVGYASLGSDSSAGERAKLSRRAQTVVNAIGCFGEGVAMLAAAGGPDIHPHAVSKASDRERWDRDVANFATDLRKVEQFFFDVLDERLTGADVQKIQMSFFGVQGPWYTVGWKMAVVIEKELGRPTLIACLRDRRKLLSTYNEAAQMHNDSAEEELEIWSPRLIDAIEPGR